METQHVLPLWVRVDPGVMAIKRHSSLPRTSGLEPYNQMVQCHNQDIC